MLKIKNYIKIIQSKIMSQQNDNIDCEYNSAGNVILTSCCAFGQNR